jgi:hypothetical protein
MNQFVIVVLIIFALAWLIYLAGLRDRRIAFSLWFPVAASSFIGTLVWLWAILGLLTAPKSGDAALGFYEMGAAIVSELFLICPIVLVISIWQRPRSESYGLIQTSPIIVLYFGLLFFYRPISEAIDNRYIQLSVLDTKRNPVAHAEVDYETSQKTYQFSFPSSPMKGTVYTGLDGIVLLPVPKTHEIDCTIKADGYATLRISMDRAWGSYSWRTATVTWIFAPDDPKKPWETHGGTVQTDIEDSKRMHLDVYLPHTRAEVIPNYGPKLIFNNKYDASGKQIWTPEPSTVRLQ